MLALRFKFIRMVFRPMSEGDMRGKVVRALRSLDAWAVENRAKPGTPDVNYIGGWVELKWVRAWPKNKNVSEVKIDHFTKEQRICLKQRWRKGGRSFLLLQANGPHWLLFDGETAAQCVGRVTMGELYQRALMTMTPFNKEKLIQWLTMDLPSLQQRRQSLLTAFEEAKLSAKPLSD